MTPGKLFRKVRRELDLTQGRLANLLNVHQAAISKVELGLRSLSLEWVRFIVKMAKEKGVKVNLEDFLSEKD